LVFDNASYFFFTEYALEKGIKIKYLANYYPQENDVVELMNKNMIRTFSKIVVENQRNSHNTLSNALWVDRVTLEVSLGNSPYFFVYGEEAILPLNVFLHSLKLDQPLRGTPVSTLQ
jgi:hypothetical protein